MELLLASAYVVNYEDSELLTEVVEPALAAASFSAFNLDFNFLI